MEKSAAALALKIGWSEKGVVTKILCRYYHATLVRNTHYINGPMLHVLTYKAHHRCLLPQRLLSFYHGTPTRSARRRLGDHGVRAPLGGA